MKHHYSLRKEHPQWYLLCRYTFSHLQVSCLLWYKHCSISSSTFIFSNKDGVAGVDHCIIICQLQSDTRKAEKAISIKYFYNNLFFFFEKTAIEKKWQWTKKYIFVCQDSDAKCDDWWCHRLIYCHFPAQASWGFTENGVKDKGSLDFNSIQNTLLSPKGDLLLQLTGKKDNNNKETQNHLIQFKKK